MHNSEIELKCPIANIAAFESRLHDLGFHLETPRSFEHNTLYDTPERALRNKRQILRLRRYNNIFTVTHKRIDEEQQSDTTRYKIRIETETTVSEPCALDQIFRQLGYSPAFIYEKYRTEYTIHDSLTDSDPHIVLDETPIGVFAELEGPTDWIDRTIVALHIDQASCLTDSYGKLFLDWKQRTGSPAQNLTFDEVLATA
jgi:adenylate cyclase class 2